MLDIKECEFQIIPAIGDGSCMFHSILQAFNKTYNTLDNNGKRFMVRDFRNDLSDVLTEEIDGMTIYDTLSRGKLKEFSNFYPPASLKVMQRDLKNNTWGDIRFLELLTNILDLNIFIIDKNKSDVYHTGDSELLYKHRDSIIILNINNIHFDTVGLKTNHGIKTLFDKDDSIVKTMLSKVYKGRSK